MARSPVSEPGTPAHLRQGVQQAEHRLLHHCWRQCAHPMLTIERAHLRQPVEETRVICEHHAPGRPGDEEARRIHRGHGSVIVAHRQLRVTRKELLDRHSPNPSSQCLAARRTRSAYVIVAGIYFRPLLIGYFEGMDSERYRQACRYQLSAISRQPSALLRAAHLPATSYQLPATT